MVLSEGLFQLNATDPAAAAAVSPDGAPGTGGAAVVGGGAVVGVVGGVVVVVVLMRVDSTRDAAFCILHTWLDRLAAVQSTLTSAVLSPGVMARPLLSV